MIPVITFFDILFNRELKDSLIMHGISYVIIGFIYLFQQKRYYIIARVLFISAIIGITYVFTNYTTPHSLIENFYFIYPLIALILIEEKWINISILILCFFLYFVPNLYFEHYPVETILPVLIFCVFSGAFVILNYSKVMNIKSEEKLEAAYKELEKRKKSEFAHLQLKYLRAQMNPHFMFNTMNSIQSLVLKGNKLEAYNYLNKFASLIRENLNMSEKSFVQFDEELSLLKKYLELEKLRFQEDFEFDIIGENEINNIKIPSMLIQPFIENAIKHGLLHKMTGIKKIKIEFSINNVLKCIITDNGVGIKASQKIKTENLTKEPSFSTKAVKDQLEILKDYYKTDIGFYYEEVLEGTKVVLKIPYITE
ncbi:sensor histidine kinase [Polaribacter sp. Q13]|uniref:sensor histidine kinase n=1 Tax=Polaribacter sp. Q13 TaxID=2806551 RepID=UPI00193B46E0|nr:histidine kinase [Polaribacter sp. Q13]QVY67208.1 histidine kinase [Polaribacter sp. Q13]